MVKQIMLGIIWVVLTVLTVRAQNKDATTTLQKSTHLDDHKIVVVTGARFSYHLVQKWIDDFNKDYPDIQVVIESRGSSDPLKYDILAEVYEHPEDIKAHRQYLYIGKYAILPVAKTQSQFAAAYASKGLNDDLIKQMFFHNIFADEDEEVKIKVPYTVYTRFQKAGAPKVFAEFYGFEQKDINGKAIAGSDEHLLKALLRDSTGITYLPLPLLFNPASTKGFDEDFTILPVDLDGNGKIKDDERSFFSNPETLIKKLEGQNNVPAAYFHLSVDKNKASDESVAFLKWVATNGARYLNSFGFLKSETHKDQRDSFKEFASKKHIN
ncbi:MAG TPA: hypothetical protein VD884_16255 [Ohtaekwangia sp.]|nr:hypothetical protein [Ohtaekwangia sp.]